MFRHTHHAQIDSTNDEATRLWRRTIEQLPGQAPQPMLISADVQTAGRGREGRLWLSPAGGLWMTLAWPAPRDADHYRALPMAVGLAVAEAVESFAGIAASIKWPNDLLVEDRKLAGILCRYEPMSRPVVIVGIGVNANLRAEQLGSALRQPATSLLDERGKPVDLAGLRDAVAQRLQQRLGEYDRTGLASMLTPITGRLAWVGLTVACELPGGRTIKGRLIGIDASGRLELTDGPNITNPAVDAGEIVHLRPPTDPARPALETLAR